MVSSPKNSLQEFVEIVTSKNCSIVIVILKFESPAQTKCYERLNGYSLATATTMFGRPIHYREEINHVVYVQPDGYVDENYAREEIQKMRLSTTELVSRLQSLLLVPICLCFREINVTQREKDDITRKSPIPGNIVWTN